MSGSSHVQLRSSVLAERRRVLLVLVRREMWEHPWIYGVPVATAGATVALFLITAIADATGSSGLVPLPDLVGRAAVWVAISAMLVGAAYCLESLQTERRDRSILLWKSLPATDAMVLLSKAAVPLIVLPALTVVAVIAAQLIMVASGALVAGAAAQAAPGAARLLRLWSAEVYFIVVTTLWHAPFYGWLLLSSAWSPRMPLVTAVLPLLTITAAEVLVFRSGRLVSWLMYRWSGVLDVSVQWPQPGTSRGELPELTPVTFLTTADVWFGLLFAAASLAAAVWWRRHAIAAA